MPVQFTGVLEAASGFGKERIVRTLVGAGALAKVDEETNSSRRAKKYRTPGGGNCRFYVIDPDLLESEGKSQCLEPMPRQHYVFSSGNAGTAGTAQFKP